MKKKAAAERNTLHERSPSLLMMIATTRTKTVMMFVHNQIDSITNQIILKLMMITTKMTTIVMILVHKQADSITDNHDKDDNNSNDIGS